MTIKPILGGNMPLAAIGARLVEVGPDPGRAGTTVVPEGRGRGLSAPTKVVRVLLELDPAWGLAEQTVAIDRLEHELDALNADLPRLKEFILPGGGPSAAACHVARSVVRRAERRVISLSAAEDVRPEAIMYLNRLSDLLFVMARVIARAESGQEVLWNRDR